MRRLTFAVCAVLVGCGGSGSAGDDATDGGPGADASIGGTCTGAPLEGAGEGTYYAATGAGNCSFDATPGDLMVAALNAPDYGSADGCGACVAVTGPAGEVTVRIVDSCPECAAGDLDLSAEAFAMISPLSAGRVAISWREVPCDVSGPLGYHFKDGSSQYWTAIQVRNHRYPIARLEAEQGGAYVDIPRLSYNYFVAEGGLGVGPYALRVTDTRGHVVEDTGIAVGDDVTRTGAGQFPVCP